MRSSFLTLVLLVLFTLPSAHAERRNAAEKDQLVVHEWGTFTTLQDESGRDLSGINIDDEPVPGFVHNLSRFILQPSFLTDKHWVRRQKGAPPRHPRVTMRLETPVIYFHLPEGSPPVELDVGVDFRGGWLTEFYPNAKASAPGVDRGFLRKALTEDTLGQLDWKCIRVGEKGKFPKTDEAVWTTPRKVDSDPVISAQGEAEQYIFYRGVARRRSPLRVETSKDRSRLTVRGNFSEVACTEGTIVPAMWLVDVKEDGRVAFREVDAKRVTKDESLAIAEIDAEFKESDYHKEHLVVLKKLMWIAIYRDGLYGDEATAMLDTWNRAYFESPGRRLFFVVPREWTDHYLPLEIPKAQKVERVMIGRVELITQKQRRILREIAGAEV
ncbi:MAG: hypothetical protein AAF517_28205, partial [Planctomycetota bacterium]